MQNGKSQITGKESKIKKSRQKDKMGSFLDCSEDLRKDKKGSSWQAHNCKKVMEKNQA